MPWNRKKLYWWAGGPITTRFRNSRKSLYLGQISSNFFKISQHASPRHAPCPGTEKIIFVGRGPHHHPLPEFAEKLVSRPNLVEFLKNFTACIPWACSVQLNEKKLDWWAGGPIISAFRISGRVVSRL